MIELWKTIIERATSSPVAILILGFLFRKPINKLITRISLLQFKGGGVEFSASGTATAQLDAEDRSKSDPLAVHAGPQLNLPIAEDVAKRQEAVRNYGGDNELLLLQMQAIKNDLAVLNFPLESAETTEILVRHLAATQLIQRAEFLYRVIFGSQVAAMRIMNESGPQPENAVRRVYESARSRSPRFYAEYEFEQWIGFLMQQKVVVFENERYAITLYGREFLGFLTSQGLPRKAH